MKKILCVNYSQSGQLDEILDHFTEPLASFQVERVKIEPKQAYPFPWATDNFYQGMPETVQETPIELQPFSFKEEHYDLIILGYQPWFLSPSLPTTSLLKHPDFMDRLKGTPVLTVIGARNMWLNAHDSVVNLIEAAGGYIVGNHALVDRAPNQLSAISIVHWMMTGKKTRKWGIFPLPGISQEDIEGSNKFGKILSPYIEKGDYIGLQDQIIQEGGLRVHTNILFIEGKAKKIFRIWAKLILKKEAEGKNRNFWIAFFRFYLNFALFVVAPILLLFYTILIRPFLSNKIRAKKKRYSFLGIRSTQ